jgi:hypothetical protein
LNSTNGAPTEVFSFGEDTHGPFLVIGRDHHLGVALADLARGGLVAGAVQCDGPSECRDAVGKVGLDVGGAERLCLGHSAGVVVLYDDGAGFFHEVAQDVQCVVHVGEVDLARVLAGLEKLDVGCQPPARLYHLHVAEREVAVNEPVQRGLLGGVLAVAQALDLAADLPARLLVNQGLLLSPVNKTDLHSRREAVTQDGLVHLLQILGHLKQPPNKLSSSGRAFFRP